MARTPSIDGIARRDFLNGLLIAAGGAVSRSVSACAFAGGTCDGPIGLDPRALRGGNLPSVFAVSHWLRDGRLTFEKGSVSLAPGCDESAGTFPILDTNGSFDVIVIGGGLSGLSAAHHLLRERPQARLLILEAAPVLGGNAGRDDAPPLPGPASTAGAYGAAPSADWLRQFYRAIDVDWLAQSVPGPESSFYFDEFAPGLGAGARGWNIDTFEHGAAHLPYDARLREDFARAFAAIRALGEKGLAEPADESDPTLDDLSSVSLAQHLETALGCDAIVSRFFTAYTLTAFGGTAEQVNAHSAITFLSSELTRGSVFTYPGGTSEIARRISRQLAQSETPPRFETNATALRIETTARGASVVYFQDGRFHRIFGERIILAAPAQSARHLVAHLSDAARNTAWTQFHAAPLVTANVTLRCAAPLLQLGLGYSQSWWGGRHFVNYIVADWMSDKRAAPQRQTTLTFYGGCDAPLGALAEARMRLMHTPFSDYEDSLRSDLSRLMRGADFDFDRDVRALFLYRWGHSMLRPPPGFLFGATRGASGKLDRAQAPRRIACAPMGPIVFAGQHVEGTPSIESAIGSGRRAAQQALETAPR
ncbi:FAD-dependent oxidoreductase [Methylosinus sporium]|uniref:FAD-dependent oxidoreductase n=1 Tax=Methylosinus sporium TaxID=428 RepID=A0A549SZK2_METSR|nr:FAD-dependent oxidoreductase [Methylosinus sporium]TRL35062.1 FAD-dependent oxidoreductase [Methylosinus sporium]